jgi:putative peptide zinc metalloprotease protein
MNETVIRLNVDAEKWMEFVPELAENLIIKKFHSTTENEYIVYNDNQHYVVGKKFVDVLRKIDGKRNIKDIQQLLQKKWGVRISDDEFKIFFDNNIKKKCILKNFEHNKEPAKFLKLKKTLLRKEKVAKITSLTKIFIDKKWFIFFSILFILLNTFILLKKTGLQTLRSENYEENVVLLLLLLSITGLFHEIGHASASHKYLKESSDIGWGVYLFYPVFFTDVTKIWRLTRIRRLLVDASGIYFQCMAICVVEVALMLLHMPSLLFMFFDVSLFYLFINLNPIMKMDGYWMVTDILGVKNLDKIVFGVIKNNIARRLKKNEINQENMLCTSSRFIYIIVKIYSIATIVFWMYFAFVVIKRIYLYYIPVWPNFVISQLYYIKNNFYNDIFAVLTGGFILILNVFLTIVFAFFLLIRLLRFIKFIKSIISIK